MKQKVSFKSDFSFEELFVGMKLLHGHTNQDTSYIIALTSNSIEVWVEKDKSAIRKKADEDGDVGYKGISYKNWYALNQFNETFKRIMAA
jgi:hypothetical protein